MACCQTWGEGSAFIPPNVFGDGNTSFTSYTLTVNVGSPWGLFVIAFTNNPIAI
jgi:hypothetical protein